MSLNIIEHNIIVNSQVLDLIVLVKSTVTLLVMGVRRV